MAVKVCGVSRNVKGCAVKVCGVSRNVKGCAVKVCGVSRNVKGCAVKVLECVTLRRCVAMEWYGFSWYEGLD